jgi:hypothetical protein
MNYYTKNLEIVKENISSDSRSATQRGEGMGKVLSNDNTFPFAFNDLLGVDDVGDSRPNPLALRFALPLLLFVAKYHAFASINSPPFRWNYCGYLDYTPNLVRSLI